MKVVCDKLTKKRQKKSGKMACGDSADGKDHFHSALVDDSATSKWDEEEAQSSGM